MTTAPAPPYQVTDRHVGAPHERIEDAELLTGRGRFMDDLNPLPGALEATVVRSPHPHARITGFDASRRRALAGRAVRDRPAPGRASCCGRSR